MPFFLIGTYLKQNFKGNLQGLNRKINFKYCRAILQTGCLLGLLIYASCYMSKALAQGAVTLPPTEGSEVINNLNIKSPLPLKVPDPLEKFKTKIKLSCAGANLFLFIQRPVILATPYEFLEDYAIWHDFRFPTKNDQIKNLSIRPRKIKKLRKIVIHTNTPKPKQATKLVRTKDNKILLIRWNSNREVKQ